MNTYEFYPDVPEFSDRGPGTGIVVVCGCGWETHLRYGDVYQEPLDHVCQWITPEQLFSSVVNLAMLTTLIQGQPASLIRRFGKLFDDAINEGIRRREQH